MSDNQVYFPSSRFSDDYGYIHCKYKFVCDILEWVRETTAFELFLFIVVMLICFAGFYIGIMSYSISEIQIPEILDDRLYAP